MSYVKLVIFWHLCVVQTTPVTTAQGWKAYAHQANKTLAGEGVDPAGGAADTDVLSGDLGDGSNIADWFGMADGDGWLSYLKNGRLGTQWRDGLLHQRSALHLLLDFHSFNKLIHSRFQSLEPCGQLHFLFDAEGIKIIRNRLIVDFQLLNAQRGLADSFHRSISIARKRAELSGRVVDGWRIIRYVIWVQV